MWMNGILYLFHTRGGNDALAEKYLFGYYKDRENIALENEGASISELDLLEKIDGYENRLSNTSGKGIFASGTPVWVYFVIIGALIVLVTLIAMLVRYRLRFRYVMRRYEEYMHDPPQRGIRPPPAGASCGSGGKDSRGCTGGRTREDEHAGFAGPRPYQTYQ